ncbi:MAG: GMC family oxidoreductase [Gemmatimonadetes bacterium]|nr:GMC family oxidoreductase [Gemmatimonadota bacterium]
MSPKVWDAIVVGSGISGGWAAKELTERGLEVLVLEAGPPIDPAKDYVEHVQAWEMPFRGYGDRKKLAREQPEQSKCYACDEMGSKFFVNDHENPYSYDADKPFSWIRGRHVGGRSIMWGRQVYRWSDLDFEANARDGHGVDWPIRYADIAPWYDHVERFIGVSGNPEGLSQLPDGQFLPPMRLRCAEVAVRDALQAKWGRDRVLTIGRCAILTQPHNGRAACHYCGPCERGCITHSYFSSNGSTLPAAANTGRMTLRPNSVVAEVLYDARRDKARGGRNVMDHCFGAGAGGTMPGMLDKTYTGSRPNGIYIPRFRNVKEQHPDFVRGYGFQGGAGRGRWSPQAGDPGFGAEFKRRMINERGPWSFSIGGWGECLPRSDNFVALDPALKDAWGIPALKIQCTWSDNERNILKDIQVTAAEMLEAAGATDIHTYDDHLAPGLCIHEMGTARMGRDPRTSVLNGNNQMHDVKNLFITDGACMASSANQNPSITYMALTARAAAFAVDAMKRHEL